MRPFLTLAFVGISAIAIALLVRSLPQRTLPGPTIQSEFAALTPIPAPKPDVPFVSYQPPKLPRKTAYTVVFLGDSMTAALGPYTDELRSVLKKKYPAIDLIIQNESAPSSNVASLQDRLLSRATEAGATYDPVLGKPFDIIVIESFGYNPLSYLGRAEGINKANESLTQAMKILIREQPNALIIFLATIAPSRTLYAVGTAVKLTPAQRVDWVSERDQYIENHIKFAKDHNIPLVDVYHQSQDKTGNGLLQYINAGDHIHPSQEGVNFIQDRLAQFMVDTKIFE